MKRSILYFDDEDACLRSFQEAFGEDYDVCTALTLAEARLKLAECRPDLVISDHLMPEIEGAEFLREVAERCPASYRVMLSGGVSVGDMIGKIGSGIIQMFVAKPWREQTMRRMLERAGVSLDIQNGAELTEAKTI